MDTKNIDDHYRNSEIDHTIFAQSKVFYNSLVLSLKTIQKFTSCKVCNR